MHLTVDESDKLRSTFQGSWLPGGGIERPVYLGLRELQIGDVLYRGCTAACKAAAEQMLEEARFFSITQSGIASYSKPKPGDRPGLNGFRLCLTVADRVTLANVSLFPLVQRAAPTSPQEWQRLNGTTIASRMIGKAIDGVWDHDGEEVLIEKPHQKLRLIKIDEVNLRSG